MLRLVLLYLLSQRFTQCEAMGSGSSGGSDWRYFAAGGTSAAFSHGITTYAKNGVVAMDKVFE